MREQESRSRKVEEVNNERLNRLETMVYAQHEKLDRLEDLVYRVMHQDRVGHNLDPTTPKYEDYSGMDTGDETASTSWQSEINDQDSPLKQNSPCKPQVSARKFAIPEF